jgi:hypothetical protein
VHALLARYTMSLALRRFLHALFDRVSFADAAWEGVGRRRGEALL